ncbi:MAG: hypothetical protein GY715_20020 [Planctomycetes bacterium]|nr:hypothetical protein [Planctomycetota bacterium]
MGTTRAAEPPPAELIQDVIRRAHEHPLGTSFLTEGALDAVAATFEVHAFVVDAARETLREAPVPTITTTVGTPIRI